MKYSRPNYILTVALFISLMILNCGGKPGDDNPDARGGPGSMRGRPQNSAAIPVQVASIEKGDISTFLMQTTTIEAERQVDILSKVSGQVIKLPVEEGARVKKDDLLVQLDEAELKINYMRAKVSLETDKSLFDRTKDLFERKLVATEAYEAARLQYESSKATYEAARLQLDYTNVRSPFDAIVITRNIELGQRVNVNQSLFLIADFEPLRAKIYVPEKDLGRLFEGQAAKITVEAEPGIDFQGVVKMISPIVDPESGTSKVTIDIADHQNKLKPGMFSSVFIITDTHVNTLIMPKKALVLETDLDQVYIYRDGTAHKVNLKLGFSSGQDVEVLSGLIEGDLVVTAGQDGLREGLPIHIPQLDQSQEARVDQERVTPPQRSRRTMESR